MFEKEYEIMKKAVRYVGDNIFLDHAKTITSKGAFDYFTDKDIECEKYIIDTIKKNFPNDNIVSEETNSQNEVKNRSWIIDPIDGTLNYMYDLPICGVQVAFFADNDYQFSFIYLPYIKEFYYAIKGRGAFLNDKRIENSPVETKDALVDIDLHTRDTIVAKMELDSIYELLPHVLRIRMSGSACFSLSKTASSCFGAHLIVAKKLNPWDIMPGLLICKESQKFITDEIYKDYRLIIVAQTKELQSLLENIFKKNIDKMYK